MSLHMVDMSYPFTSPCMGSASIQFFQCLSKTMCTCWAKEMLTELQLLLWRIKLRNSSAIFFFVESHLLYSTKETQYLDGCMPIKDYNITPFD